MCGCGDFVILLTLVVALPTRRIGVPVQEGTVLGEALMSGHEEVFKVLCILKAS